MASVVHELADCGADRVAGRGGFELEQLAGGGVEGVGDLGAAVAREADADVLDVVAGCGEHLFEESHEFGFASGGAVGLAFGDLEFAHDVVFEVDEFGSGGQVLDVGTAGVLACAGLVRDEAECDHGAGGAGCVGYVDGFAGVGLVGVEVEAPDLALRLPAAGVRSSDFEDAQGVAVLGALEMALLPRSKVWSCAPYPLPV